MVLGGGDGLAVREILRYDSIESITLVDLDSDMTRLFANHPLLTPLNDNALQSPKVQIINQDAFKWLAQNADILDVYKRQHVVRIRRADDRDGAS